MKTTNLADVSRWFFETIADLQKTQEIVTIGLPGGTSLDGWYSELVSLLGTQCLVLSTSGINFNNIRFCLVDERCVDAENPDRNDRHVFERLIQPLCEKGILKPEQFIRPGEMVDALEYNEAIYRAQTPLNPPLSGGQAMIDIAIFGIGPDGHIASLFPHHPALEAQVDGFIRIHDAPKNPPERISLSPLTISEMTHTCVFAVGESKKEAFASFFDDSKTFYDCPAKILTPEIIFDATN